MDETRREILRRRQEARFILPKWKTSLEDATGHRVSDESFIGLVETERLRSDFFANVRNGNYKRWYVGKEHFGDLVLAFQNMATKYNKLNVVLFHSKDEYIGALWINGEVVFSKLQAIWQVAEEDFCVATIDLTSGLCVEENYYDQFGKYVSKGVLEVTAWGDFVCPVPDQRSAPASEKRL